MVNQTASTKMHVLLHELVDSIEHVLVQVTVNFTRMRKRNPASVLADFHPEIVNLRNSIKTITIGLLNQETRKLIEKLLINPVQLKPVLLFLKNLQLQTQTTEQVISPRPGSDY